MLYRTQMKNKLMILPANERDVFMQCVKNVLNRYWTLAVAVLLTAVSASTTTAQNTIRKEIHIPDIRGYVTLKCDFHMHTVFSDGTVWPTERSTEIWREGLDVFSITDHIEYQPHKGTVSTDHNVAYETAVTSAENLGLILIKGTEVTRAEPFGHHNAIFITDAAELAIPDSMVVLKKAKEQGGLILWNHPGWKRPDRKGVWTALQDEVYDSGYLDGIEVVNGSIYDPNAHAFAIEKKLIMFGNSDIHAPSTHVIDGSHRTMTLLFAKDRTAKAVKEALFKRRTVVYDNDILIGEEQYLEPIFMESITLRTPDITFNGAGSTVVQITNDSDIPYTLESNGSTTELAVPARIELIANSTVRFAVRNTDITRRGTKKVRLGYKVTNLWTAPGECLDVEIPVKVTFIPGTTASN